MDSINRLEIAKGVYFNSIKDNRFKTSKISVSFIVPLKKETASVNALLSGVMTRTTSKYPDFTLLSKKLSDLYGAHLGGFVRKTGDNQIVTFSISGIDDKYVFEGDNISKDMTDLLCNIIFNPKLDGNSFCEEEITQEKRQLKEVIDSEFNDKRTYSINQAVKIICKDEPYSLSKFGTKEDIDKVTGEDLYNGWLSLLNNSRVEIFYVGDSSSDAVIDELKAQFSKYDRTECEINNIVSGEVTEVKTVKEEMELSQSKMILAFRTDISDNKDNTMPMRLAVAMLGGTAHSKLFNNVREKLSLCYYCSSRFIKNKGLMFIESGVEKKNIEEAKNAILKELDDLAKGNFTDFEINATKLSMCNSFITIADNEFGLETWYFSQVLSNKISSVEDACKEVNSVTREEIIEMAKKLKLDTVYTLESKE